MTVMTICENRPRTSVAGKLAGLQRPGESLDVSEVVDRARALLRNGVSTDHAQRWAERLTAYEDWLEYEHPRLNTEPLRVLRRKLELLA